MTGGFSSFVQASAAAFMLWSQKDASTSGFVMNYAMQTTIMLQLTVGLRTSMELDIISVDRVEEYTKLEQEGTREKLLRPGPMFEPSPEWPFDGEITFEDYSATYKEGTKVCLDSVNIDIKAKERVMVVGRSGAGKSSLLLAIAKMLDPVQGRIRIDRTDISTVDANVLRSRLAIIPQSPAAFSGTLRTNLDPSGVISDEVLLAAVRKTCLDVFLGIDHNCLDYVIEPQGQVFDTKGQDCLLTWHIYDQAQHISGTNATTGHY